MKLLYGCRPLTRTGSFGRSTFCPQLRIRFYTTPTANPLRILFCGSDDFSAVSLEKLHEESLKNPELIASIDVVCKAGKPSGRGLREIRDVPIKNVAKNLNLPLHEIPTFKGFSPPVRDGMPTNLVIAVSFGLLVPGRILSGLEYGGMNLHPSLLPELQGPAPLQHTILKDLKTSGITLQTLHPKHFDQGIILAQDHFDLPEDASTDINLLRQLMSHRAAELLVTNLRKGIFLPPMTAATQIIHRPQSHAPKITSEDAHIAWTEWSTDEILRAQAAIGPLWSNWSYKDAHGKHQLLRIQWHELRNISTQCPPSAAGVPAIIPVRTDVATSEEGPRSQVGGVWTRDGHFLSPSCVTIAGRKKGWPGNAGRTVDYLWTLAKTGSTEEEMRSNVEDNPRLC